MSAARQRSTAINAQTLSSFTMQTLARIPCPSRRSTVPERCQEARDWLPPYGGWRALRFGAAVGLRPWPPPSFSRPQRKPRTWSVPRA
jgi:hypothetical protein